MHRRHFEDGEAAHRVAGQIPFARIDREGLDGGVKCVVNVGNGAAEIVVSAPPRGDDDRIGLRGEQRHVCRCEQLRLGLRMAVKQHDERCGNFGLIVRRNVDRDGLHRSVLRRAYERLAQTANRGHRLERRIEQLLHEAEIEFRRPAHRLRPFALRVSRGYARAGEQIGVVEQPLIVVEGRVGSGDRRDRIEMRKVDRRR